MQPLIRLLDNILVLLGCCVVLVVSSVLIAFLWAANGILRWMNGGE